MVDLKKLFTGFQDEMKASLGLLEIPHAPTKGDYAELDWLSFLKSYLPQRYAVEKAFVIDHKGNISHAIDIVVFDSIYSPFLLNKNGVKLVPAESVYAVFEVKQDLSKKHIEYAAAKAESVRKLKRTSTQINNAGKIIEPKDHFDIIAGILCTRTSWKNGVAGTKTQVKKHILNITDKKKRLDIGCCLDTFTFINNDSSIKTSKKNTALVFFFLTLLNQLQVRGTVPALDIEKYLNSL